ncbi:2-phospho-L-lactate transferase [Poseidonocella sedimentorum]|uniref:2-phospho-L-lactate transferase n=1 Tax=Poseidonocella sedimentorum TaxID=871652 RepID=UPI001FE797A0|nr:2-phospho-L-lactate transferase [Poseidonocella sedimentorum]
MTLLAGGVGGAKMAEGFAALADVELTVIGNVADDEAFHGLWVSPDIDTVTYTLAGLINRDQGWGVADEAGRALEVLKTLGEDTWMFLGDRDFGLHIHRTARRARGERPSVIARDVARAFGVEAEIVLPTDDRVQTKVETDAGWIGFQDYFVRQQCAPEVKALRYDGIEAARPTPEALAALAGADLIVIAPSNPLVSIRPILGIPGIAEAVKQAAAPVVAVSPLIAGRVVKGPADRMMAALGHRVDAVGIAEIYAGLAGSLVIDEADAALAGGVRAAGPEPVIRPTLMTDLAGKRRLAGEILALCPEPVA